VEGHTVQNPLRRSIKSPRSRALTADQYDEVQKLVFDLVRERLVEAFGPTGMYSVGLKDVIEEHSVFNETVAESLAWDIAAQLAPKTKKKHEAAAGAPVVTAPVVTMPVETPAAEPDDARAEQLVA
jgi:hypothetical protein